MVAASLDRAKTNLTLGNRLALLAHGLQVASGNRPDAPDSVACRPLSVSKH